MCRTGMHQCIPGADIASGKKHTQTLMHAQTSAATAAVYRSCIGLGYFRRCADEGSAITDPVKLRLTMNSQQIRGPGIPNASISYG